MSESTIDLTILIPTYNEAGRIGKSLKTLADFIKDEAQGITIEVLVVDADSPDGTADIVKKHAKDFAHLKVVSAGPKPAGQFIKGLQVAKGVAAAKGSYVMFMDADLATPLKYLKDVFSIMERNEPVGICVRNLSQSHKGIRKFVSNIGNWIVRVLLTPGIRDTQCGFKVFRADVADQLFSQQRIISWGFDMELLALARKYHYPVTLIDVPDWKDVVEGSKIAGNSALKAAIQTFPDLARIKWGLLTGKYISAKKI